MTFYQNWKIFRKHYVFFCFLEKSFKKEFADDCWLKSAILGETVSVTITGETVEKPFNIVNVWFLGVSWPLRKRVVPGNKKSQSALGKNNQ